MADWMNIFNDGENIRKFRINLVTLTFTGEEKELEADFQEQYAVRALNQMRFALFSSLIIYSLFGILDIALIPDFTGKMWTERYLLVTFALLGLLFLSFLPFFKKIMQPVGVLLVIFTALGLLRMMAVAPGNLSNYYFAGLGLILIMNYGFLRLRFIWASVAGIIVVTAYIALSFSVFKTPFLQNIVNSFFLLFMNIIGMFIAYNLELNYRRVYYTRQLLHIERSKLKTLNARLEAKVKDKAAQIGNLNKEIQKGMEKKE